jgi:hypothetical protein
MPERRTNKNGVTSTKWVKSGQPIPQNTKVMPPLPGAKNKGLPFKKDQLRKSFNLGAMTGNKNVEKVLRGQINMMSEENVDLALKTFAEHTGSHVNRAVRGTIDVWARTRKRSDVGLLTCLKFDAVESVYDNYSKKPLFGSPYKAQEIRIGVSSSLSARDDRYLTDELWELNEYEFNEALMAGYVAAIIETHLADFDKDRSVTANYGYVFQDHGDLVGVFTEFPDRRDEMLTYVYENGPDAGALRQHMRGDHSALSGGAL